MHCIRNSLVQCTKITLTGVPALPRMNLLRRTIAAGKPKMTTASSITELSRATLDAAARATRISMDGPPLFTAYLRDISEQKRAEQQRNVRLLIREFARRDPEDGSRAAGAIEGSHQL